MGRRKGFHHTQETKSRIRQQVTKAHRRGGAYVSDEGLASIREKLAERMTPERRRRFSDETKRSRQLAYESRRKKADAFARRHDRLIREMLRLGIGATKIAVALTEAGHVSPRGGAWTAQTVRQVLKRMKNWVMPKRDLSSEVLVNVPIVQNVVRTGSRQKIIRWERLT
jgi:recombinase